MTRPTPNKPFHLTAASLLRLLRSQQVNVSVDMAVHNHSF